MSDLFDNLYIFEMANNHQGSVEHGLKVIEAMGKIARQTRIKAAVKLQFRELDTFIHPKAKGRKDLKHIGRFEETRLTKAQFRTLVEATRAEGMLAVATPFDEASVGTCLDLGIQIIKVASCSSTDWPLLTAIAGARKPVIMSTGGCSIYDIDSAVSFMRKRVPDFAVLHCVGVYPTPLKDLHLNFIDKLRARFPYVTIGYSGHEDPNNTEVVAVAVSKGAKILERHVGVTDGGVKLNNYSMNPEQTLKWVEAAERARTICGPTQEKAVSQEEIESLRSLQRGVYAKRDIKKGDTLKAGDVSFSMPCAEGQLTSGQFGHLRAKYVASRDYSVGEAVVERPQEDGAHWLRSILHDVKGLLYEAHVELGHDYTVEVSHHFGLDSFRQTGTVIVNIINREYCKKVLVMLPGQGHPLHRHRLKEETFQVLWGDIDVTLNGNLHRLKAGDKLLVERGALHGFSSVKGGIFEEISTTHVNGDSYYEDPRIAELDPMQRKTILESW
ncbi:MAG: N-acetylneuraminate synthase family protein [Planctomycetota bacterium]